jgi:hypothetical protein
MDMVEATRKRIGLSDDPAIRQLQLKLGDLAVKFSATPNPDQVVEEYKQTVNRLYELGWDGIIPFDSELPDPYMPEAYLKRNPEMAEPIENGQRRATLPPTRQDAHKPPDETITMLFSNGNMASGQLIFPPGDYTIGQREINKANPRIKARKNGVADRHLRLIREHEQWFVVDLKSEHGTILNSVPLGSGVRYRLRASDKLTLGSVTAVIVPTEDAAPAKPHPEE